MSKKNKHVEVHVEVPLRNDCIDIKDATHDTYLFKMPIPTPAENIILQLDIRGIKWKKIIFDDYRKYRGRKLHNQAFEGDRAIIEISDKRDPIVYKNRLLSANQVIRKRTDALDPYIAMVLSHSKKPYIHGIGTSY